MRKSYPRSICISPCGIPAREPAVNAPQALFTPGSGTSRGLRSLTHSPSFAASALVLSVALLLACSDESLHTIQYGPLVAVEAVLGNSTITAGGQTTVSCELKAAPGLQVQDPGLYETFVEPTEGLNVDGFEVKSFATGEHEVRCGVVASEDVTRVPAWLTVEPAEAYRMEIVVEPVREFYSVGEEVTLTAVVLDVYENAIDWLADQVEWTLPTRGMNKVSESPSLLVLSFERDGSYRVLAGIGAPYHLGAPEQLLVCDSSPPLLVVSSPRRGQSLDAPTITVSGSVSDETSGVMSLLVNGTEVEMAADGSFTTEIPPEHGLNHIALEAFDLAGNRATASTSVYHSGAWLELRAEAFVAELNDALAIHLSQDVIDSGTRSCERDSAGAYGCEEYEDVATIVEVLLNNLDVSSLVAGEVYGFGPMPLIERNLGNRSIDIGLLTLGLVNYQVNGSLILRGDYRVSASVASVEVGQVVMGNEDAGILGLRAVDGGLDILALIRPGGQSDMGLRVLLEVRLDFDVRVFFSIDKGHAPNNGVWNLNTGTEVTSTACSSLGAFATIDTALMALGYSSNFRGYVCQEEPVATSSSSATTGSSAAFERMRISGRVLLGATDEGEVAVSLMSHGGEALVDFMQGPVAVSSDESILIDLGNVQLIGGLYAVNLGQLSVGSPLTLLDPIWSTLLTELQDLLGYALEDLIVCTGSISGCPLGVEALLEDIFNSLARRGVVMNWPAIMPGGEDMESTLSLYFSSIDFEPGGGRLAFHVDMRSMSRLQPGIPEPRGLLLQDGPTPSSALSVLPRDRYMAAGLTLDLVNQALFSGWYNGGLSGTLAVSPGDTGLDSLTVAVHPLLPPIVTRRHDSDGDLELQLASTRLDLTVSIGGSQILVTSFADLAFGVEPSQSEGRLQLLSRGEVRLLELEIVAETSDLGLHRSTIEELLMREVVPGLLVSYTEGVLSGIPVPTIDLAATALPGLSLDIEMAFPTTETWHTEGVLVVVSD